MDLIKGKTAFLIHFLTNKIGAEITHAQSLGKTFSIMLAGGSSPIALYHALCENIPSWNGVHFFLGDERYCSIDHPDSNRKMIFREFLSRISITPDQIHFPQTDTNLDNDAKSYSDALEQFISAHHEIDLALVGMGNDGHTLSLFPNITSFESTQSLYIPVSQVSPHRLSGTFELLKLCREICVFAPGSKKFSVYLQTLNPQAADLLPIAKLHSGCFRTKWFLSNE